MTAFNIAWWAGYTVLAIILQSLVPGVDFLLPGFIVALQEDSNPQFLWIAGAYILLQEGMGSMAFGGTLLWYSLIVVMYICGQWLFQAESFLFVFLLSAALSAAHYLIMVTLGDLQGIVAPRQILIDECVYQALLTPVFWTFAHFTRKGLRHETAS